MKPLSNDEVADLKYFIQFCDGLRYKSGDRMKLVCGSGRGRAFAGEAFHAGEGRAMLAKSVRRGYLTKKDARYTPTQEGRLVANVPEPPKEDEA